MLVRFQPRAFVMLSQITEFTKPCRYCGATGSTFTIFDENTKEYIGYVCSNCTARHIMELPYDKVMDLVPIEHMES